MNFIPLLCPHTVHVSGSTPVCQSSPSLSHPRLPGLCNYTIKNIGKQFSKEHELWKEKPGWTKPAGKALLPSPGLLLEKDSQRGPLRCTPGSKQSQNSPFFKNHAQYHQYISSFMRRNRDTLINTMTHFFDVQGVPRDSLHGLQQEAGQGHAFTPVVCGNFLMPPPKKPKKQHNGRGLALLYFYWKSNTLLIISNSKPTSVSFLYHIGNEDQYKLLKMLEQMLL